MGRAKVCELDGFNISQFPRCGAPFTHTFSVRKPFECDLL